VGSLAYRRVVHSEITADRADDDLPRVEADPDLQLHPVRAPRVVRVALERLLHPERRVTGAHGMVLVRQRRTEECHDPIAHDLVNRPLVAVHRLHHVFEHGVEELSRLLRIAIGQQFHRTFEVRKEHGDLLSFTFEGSLGGQDLFGKVFWCVALGGIKARRTLCQATALG
jgi:hypothetical protein